MENPVHLNDLTDAMSSLRVHKDKLNEALEQLFKWKIETRVEIVQPALELKITVQKLNGQGFIKTFTKEEALYYVNDTGTLTRTIIDLIVERLISPHLDEILSPDISHALQNLSKISKLK